MELAPPGGRGTLSGTPRSPPVHAPIRTLSRETVLVVDDHGDTRDAVTALLETCGYRVLSAANGADGIRLARQRKPDLILMDIGMPVMDGLTAMQMLRQDPVTAAIPVLAVTGQSLRREQEQARTLCDGYLPKPCGPDDLLHEVRRLIPGP